MTLEEIQAAITGRAVVADERLAIYQRAYRTRLIETLHAMFPALIRDLGEPMFNDFALEFIFSEPPRGWTLERLAETFPRWLAATKPDEPWAARIVQMAEHDAAVRKRRFGQL